MTPNKYHSSGRLYTEQEYAGREKAAQLRYLWVSVDLERLPNGVAVPVYPGSTYDIAKNATKRSAKSLGFKSLKNWDRRLER